MSGGSESGGEKVHDPTPKKLEDARKKGDVAKSNEITAAAVYIGFLIAAFSTGPAALQKTGAVLSQFLAQPDRLTGVILGPGGSGLSARMIGTIAATLSPLILLPMALVLASIFAQQAFVMSFDKVRPKVSRLSMIANAKNKFGPTGLVEFVKSLVKMLAISTTAYFLLHNDIDTLVGVVRAEPGLLGVILGSLFAKLLIGVALIASAIAFFDFSWQKFDHQRKLRMSFQDLKDENKESEGDPHMKAKRRQRAREIASNRMMSEVPFADVIIVNPTHYSVALKWDRTPGSAPKCVAKGVDEIALRIREIASEAGVPIHHDVPTARALFAVVEIDQQIPQDHYRAVAAAIQFSEAIRRKAREQNWSAS